MEQEYQENTVYQGLSVERRRAAIGRRTMAYAIDLGIVNTVLYLLFFVFAFLVVVLAGAAGSFFWITELLQSVQGAVFVLLLLAVLLVPLSLYHGYFIYFELTRGATPGKRLLGLQVISVDGARLRLGQCVLRDAMRYIDCMLIVPGLLSMLSNQQHRRLGDLAAGTMVVYSQRRENQDAFLYITQDEYFHLLDILKPTPITGALCEDYLSFAYRKFIKGESANLPDDEARWESAAQQCFQANQHASLDRTTTLLFFAEHCHQSLNNVA